MDQRPAAVELSGHAKRRLRLVGLTMTALLGILAAPDALTAGHSGRTNAWHHDGRRWIRVTYIDEGATRTVVTVTDREHRGPQGA